MTCPVIGRKQRAVKAEEGFLLPRALDTTESCHHPKTAVSSMPFIALHLPQPIGPVVFMPSTAAGNHLK
jgi:hypothetical protein